MRDLNASIATLKHPDEAKRRKAAIELHRWRCEESGSALIAALADENPEVRGAAAESLRLLKDRRAVPALIKMLENDPEHVPLYSAIKAIAGFGTPECIAALISALDQRRGDASALAFELGEARAEGAVTSLIRLLHDGTPYERRHAVIALGRIRDPRALEPLARALDDADEGVRDRARSVTEPPETSLWCAFCSDWAAASLSDDEPRTCRRCGKRDVTEMARPIRFR